MVETKRVTVRFTDKNPQPVKVKFVKDGEPLEPNESFTLQLQTSTVIPTAFNYFFVQDAQLTIEDADGKENTGCG